MDAAVEAYDNAMERGDDRLSKAINEYMEATREAASKAEDELGASPMRFMEDLHYEIGETLKAGF